MPIRFARRRSIDRDHLFPTTVGDFRQSFWICYAKIAVIDSQSTRCQITPDHQDAKCLPTTR
jgi:hypothetical protein